jgi:hypothetical protein
MMSYRLHHLPKYCMRTGALHKVQHSMLSSVSQPITHWQCVAGSCWCRWRLRRVALGPVNATIFKLKLNLYRWCTFYTSARPR